MKNILVVGGSGYVGGFLVDSLIKTKSFNIKVYDYLLYEKEYLKKVDFVYGNVSDKKKLIPQLKWADCVIWLAAIVGDGACEINRDLTIKINQDSIKTLYKNFQKKIIFLSTCSVYGAQDGFLNESSPTNPLSLYAQTKLKAEKFLLSNTNATIFRLGTLYGLSDNFSRIRMDLVLNALVSKSFNENSINIYGGQQYRPLLHVKDVSTGIIQALKKPNIQGVFNLHSENIKIINLAEKVKDYFPNLKLKILKQEFKDTRNYKVTSDKAKKFLKYKPKYDIDYGINELLTILKESRIKNVYDPRYINQLFLKNNL